MELQSRIIMDLATLNKQNEEHRSVAEQRVLNLAQENAELKANNDSAYEQLDAARKQLDALASNYDCLSRELSILSHNDKDRCALVKKTQQYAQEIIEYGKDGKHPPVLISVVQSLMRTLNGVSVEDEKLIYAGTGEKAVEGESAADSNVELDATALVAAATPSVTGSSPERKTKPIGKVAV